MPFQSITVRKQQDQLIIKIIEKRIYLGITEVFASDVNEALKQEFTHVTIDFENVDVMNSSGIGVLIKARDEVSKQNKSVKLINLRPLMQEIFIRMRLDTLFEFDK